MPFQLPELPYARDALQPHMSAETLDFHYGKHHAAYVRKTNELLPANLSGASLVEVIRAARRNDDTALFNNSAQLWNHAFFWQCLTPVGESGEPRGELRRLIDEGFGGTEQLLKALAAEAVGHFSNGWAWLVLDRGALRIVSLHDADTPLVHDGMVPLLTLDVWEHAYYIDYRNERPKFVASVLENIINWEFVARNLDRRGEERADQEPATTRESETVA